MTTQIIEAPKVTSPERFKMFFLLFMTMFLLGSIQTTKGLVLEQVQHDIEISLTLLGTVMSFFQWGFTIAALFTGYLADKKGVKYMMLIGSALMAGGLVATGLSGTAAFFLGFYMVVGLGIGSMMTAICTIIPKMFSKEASTLFNVGNAFFGVGLIVAPLALNALFANDVSWRFFYYGIAAIVALMMVIMTGLSVKHSTDSEKLTFADAILVLKNKQVAILFTFFVFYVAMEAAFFNFFPMFISGLDFDGLSAAEKTAKAAGMLGMFGFMFTAFRFAGGFITKFLGEKKTLVCFSTLSLVSLVLGIMFAEQAIFLFTSFGVGLSLLWTTAQTIITRGTDKEGTVIGLTYVGAGIGGALGGQLVGSLSDAYGTTVGFSTLIIFGAIALVLAFMVKEQKPS